MTTRYSPSVRVDHARMFIEVESLRQQGHVAAAWAKFQEYGRDMANLGGAMAAQLPAVLPPTLLLPWGQPGDVGRGRLVTLGPGEFYAIPYTVPAGSDPARTVSASINEDGTWRTVYCDIRETLGGAPLTVGGGNGAGHCAWPAAAGTLYFVFGLGAAMDPSTGHALIQIPA